MEQKNKRGLCIQLLLTLGGYALLGCILISLLDYLTGSLKNTGLQWIHLRLDVLYILYLMIGFIVIFLHYWKKPWQYLNEVISAAKVICEPDEKTISLSEPLHETERMLNTLKLSMLMNQKTAREAEQKKDELVMYLAHDIRTPLTTVIGYLSLLEETPDMPIEQKAKYIGIALHKAERLEQLINELFDITRYNAPQTDLSKKKIELTCLLAQVADEFYPVLSERGNTAVLDMAESLPVMGEPEQLARAFSNLLKNAAAYSYPDTEIRIFGKKAGNSVLLSFRNQGKTIPPDELQMIFEKFHRLDTARSSDTGGSGLGLSIAREIIRSHGGELTAQSSEETITFTVTLPCD